MGLMLEYAAWNQVSPFSSTPSDISDGNPDQTHMLGIAHGEGGIGLELLGSLQTHDVNQYWTVTLGVVFELPATVGVLLVPLGNSGNDSFDESTDDSF